MTGRREIDNDEEYNNFIKSIEYLELEYSPNINVFIYIKNNLERFTIEEIENCFNVNLTYLKMKNLESDIISRRLWDKKDTCPKCGNEDFIFTFESWFNGETDYNVACKECGLIGQSRHEHYGILWDYILKTT